MSTCFLQLPSRTLHHFKIWYPSWKTKTFINAFQNHLLWQSESTHKLPYRVCKNVSYIHTHSHTCSCARCWGSGFSVWLQGHFDMRRREEEPGISQPCNYWTTCSTFFRLTDFLGWLPPSAALLLYSNITCPTTFPGMIDTLQGLCCDFHYMFKNHGKKRWIKSTLISCYIYFTCFGAELWTYWKSIGQSFQQNKYKNDLTPSE